MQVKFMEKGLDYVPILSKVNEPVRDMEDFARGMRLNHTHMEELVLYWKKIIEIQGWLLLTLFICLHNQLSSFNSIIEQMSEKRNSSNRQ